MDKEQWLAEARRYAKHIYCYEELVDDAATLLDSYFEAGDDPYVAVEQAGEDVDLERCDQASTWGINSNKPFAKLWSAGNGDTD